MAVRGSKGHRHPRQNGTILGDKLLYCAFDTTYGPDSIRRITDESALAVEIDFTWSLRSYLTLLDFLIAASVEARISLIMFEFSSYLFADLAINLNPGPAALYCPPASSPSDISVLLAFEEVPLCPF
uniref:Uncharacterized protein n=1 Tax=Tanacetum cinerariifolium TaxID=118510 RepID=A0A6L2M941_TANCI|nr:hypothetical protein [Tanacetum cinerariifolium]